jgi:glycosyltransferase 2 family protein
LKRKKLLKQSKKKYLKFRAQQKKGSCFVSISPEKALELKKQKQELLEKQKLQIGEAEQVVAKQKSKKSKLSTFILFFVNIVIVALVLFYQINSEGAIPIGDLITFKLNYWFLVVAGLLFALMMFLKSMRFNILIKQSTGRSRPFLSYKVAAIGRYYECITPMATGGQPFQVFYLTKRGLPASTALSVPLAKFFIAQMAWLTVNIFAVVFSIKNNLIGSSTIITVVAFTSFFLNVLMVTTSLFYSVSKKFGKISVVKILRLLERLKIIKDYEKQYSKVMKTLNDYQNSIKNFIKNFPSFFFLYLLSVLIIIINYSIPFFIYSALVQYDTSLFVEIVAIAIMIEIASGMIPLPGGSGMNEISFTALFVSIFTSGTLFWALIFWRFINYYIYILQGFLVILYDYFLGNKKYDWQKKKWELETESIDFKNKQLEEYKKKKRRKRRTA